MKLKYKKCELLLWREDTMQNHMKKTMETGRTNNMQGLEKETDSSRTKGNIFNLQMEEGAKRQTCQNRVCQKNSNVQF